MFASLFASAPTSSIFKTASTPPAYLCQLHSNNLGKPSNFNHSSVSTHCVSDMMSREISSFIAYASLATLGLHAVSDDAAGFLARHDVPSTFKISPWMCLYDIAWQIVDIIESSLCRSASLEDTDANGATAADVRQASTKATARVQPQSGGLTRRYHFKTILTPLAMLSLLNILTASAAPWTTVFATIFAVRALLARIQLLFVTPRRSRRQINLLTDRRRSGLANSLFICLAWAIFRTMDLAPLNIPSGLGLVFVLCTAWLFHSDVAHPDPKQRVIYRFLSIPLYYFFYFYALFSTRGIPAASHCRILQDDSKTEMLLCFLALIVIVTFILLTPKEAPSQTQGAFFFALGLAIPAAGYWLYFDLPCSEQTAWALESYWKVT